MTDMNLRRLARKFIGAPTSENAHRLARAYVRGVEPLVTKKILVSYGFGAGWSTWSSCEIATEIMLTHPAVISALEAGEQVTETHPSVVSMVREIETAGGDTPYLGGLDQLGVVEVEGPFNVEEYDGSESVRTLSSLRD